MNNNKYIPLLRFPEFQNEGEWGKKQLKDFLVEHKTKSDGKAEVYSVSVSKGVVNQIEYLGRSFSAKDTTNYKLVKPNDIIYTKSPTGAFPFGIIKQSFVKHNVIVSPLYAVFTPINKYIGYIIHSYFESPIRINNYLLPIIQKGAKNTIQISNTTFLSNGVCFPSELKEQRKIAEFFSSLDNYIDATKRKLEQLKEHKKGLMQKLFPAKGKTIPELRFPEFQNEGEWAYDYGDALFDSIVNKNHNSELPILAITQENGAVPRDMINYRVVVEDKSIDGYKVVDIGDFIISLRTFQGGIEYSIYKGICSPAYIVLRKKYNNICNDFYRHYFKSFQYIQDLNRNLEGIRDGKMVSYKQFSEIKIPYPRYEEQCKVANCLTSLVLEINAIKDKIMVLELHKKGLLQQLFPKL